MTNTAKVRKPPKAWHGFAIAFGLFAILTGLSIIAKSAGLTDEPTATSTGVTSKKEVPDAVRFAALDAIRLFALWQAAETFCEDDQFRLVSIPNDYYDHNFTDLNESEKALVATERKANETKASRDRRGFCEESYGVLGPSGQSWMYRKQPSEIVKVAQGEKEAALRLYQLALIVDQYCDFYADALELDTYLRKQGVNYSDQEPKGDFGQLLASSASYYSSQARHDRKMFCEDAYDRLSVVAPLFRHRH